MALKNLNPSSFEYKVARSKHVPLNERWYWLTLALIVLLRNEAAKYSTLRNFINDAERELLDGRAAIDISIRYWDVQHPLTRRVPSLCRCICEMVSPTGERAIQMMARQMDEEYVRCWPYTIKRLTDTYMGDW